MQWKWGLLELGKGPVPSTEFRPSPRCNYKNTVLRGGPSGRCRLWLWKRGLSICSQAAHGALNPDSGLINSALPPSLSLVKNSEGESRAPQRVLWLTSLIKFAEEGLPVTWPSFHTRWPTPFPHHFSAQPCGNETQLSASRSLTVAMGYMHSKLRMEPKQAFKYQPSTGS